MKQNAPMLMETSWNHRIRRLLCKLLGCSQIVTFSISGPEASIRCGRCCSGYGYIYEDGGWSPLVASIPKECK